MTLYFYDLETSGVSARAARIMQFGGQRTDMNLQPIGKPDNILVRLSDDVLPEPDAILVTGITPQQVRADGVTEAEFLRYFTEHVATPQTIMVGFNNIRFDDEFMRFTHYRNFYDAYEWHWQDGRGRWDLLDAVRMTRALRPEGIEWPFAADGKPSNRLELLASINKLDHEDAHDALSDVHATIALAQLIRKKQPRLYEYLFGMRHKAEVAKLVLGGNPFIYTSGRYPAEYEKTAVVSAIATTENDSGAIVFDLRHNPEELVDLSDEELTARLWPKKDSGLQPLPIKTMQFNRCPAVAPLGVLDSSSQSRLSIDLKQIAHHNKVLKKQTELIDRLLQLVKSSKKSFQTSLVTDVYSVDSQLYDGFIDKRDNSTMRAVRVAEPGDLTTHQFDFRDDRLKMLLPLYKARNFPKELNAEERAFWESFCSHQLLQGGESSRASLYFKRLDELRTLSGLTNQQRYLLEELRLYGESIIPTEIY